MIEERLFSIGVFLGFIVMALCGISYELSKIAKAIRDKELK